MKHRTEKEVHLSHSQVEEFTQCPRRYHLHRRLGLVPEFSPSGLLFGSAMHKALALCHQLRLEGRKPSLQQLHGSFQDTWDSEQLRVKLKPGESAKSLKAKAKMMLQSFMANPHSCGEVIAVEEPFQLRLSEELPKVWGCIDLIERAPDDRLVVTDFKTAKKRGEPDPEQLVLYKEAVRALDYPSNGQVNARYMVLLKTKEPDVVVYEHEAAAGDVQRLRARYEEVWQAIQSGCSFPRTGWWCRGCQWQRHCDQI